MKADAIMRVTEVLRDRLNTAVLRAGLNNGVFVGPLDDVDSRNSSLILFLYRIVPNSNLRNVERRVAGDDDDAVQVFHNSLPLDLYYLLTVGSIPDSSEEIPLRTLGYAMQELQERPLLSGPGLGHESVRATLEPLAMDEASRIWALFPAVNYRTSVAYLVTPVWIDPAKPSAGAPLVREDILRSGSKPMEAGA